MSKRFLQTFGLAAALALALLAGWAFVPSRGAAQGRAGLPAPARLRESEGRGLIVRAWVNGAGPFDFAVDTGAGATILSPRVAGEARVEVEAGAGGIEVGGLSGQSVRGGRKAFLRSLAVGLAII